MGDRERNVFLARLAEQAERYDEMAEYMEKVAQSLGDLSGEERNLLSVAYKNAVGSRRAAWRIITRVMEIDASKGDDEQARLAEEYRTKVEGELQRLCGAVLQLLDSSLISEAASGESQVFYQKMKADYYRYIAEFASGAAAAAAAESARLAYEEARKVVVRDLPVTHPIRLGLALSVAVWTYEVLAQPEEACRLARTAFEEAIEELDDIAEDSYKDTTLILQLLRDNLTLWSSDQGGGEGQ